MKKKIKNKLFSLLNNCESPLAYYTLISAVALTFDNIIFVSFISFNFSIPNAAVVGYATGMFLSYIMLKKWVFEDRWLSNKPAYEFSFFVLSGIMGVMLTFLTTKISIYSIGPNPYIAKLCAIFISFISVYMIRKLWVFKDEKLNIDSKKKMSCKIVS